MLRRRAVWTVQLSAAAIQSFERLATGALPNETGGLLIGWYNDVQIHVSDALEVADPHANPRAYERTNEAGNAALKAFVDDKSPSDPSGYVGEWHSHPAAVGPSPIDRLTFINLAAQVDSPLAMIVLARRDDSWEQNIQVVGRTRRRRKRPKGKP
jgi:proteasome lid subunit RPN8/RPN11